MVLLHEPRTSSAIRDLVEHLGIRPGSDVVVDQELRVFGEAGLGVQPVVTAYGEHEITKGFAQGTVFSTVSSVRRGDNVPKGAEVAELAFTGPNSWAETNLELLYSEEPRAAYESERGDIKGPVSIAAAFEGRVSKVSDSAPKQVEMDAAPDWKQPKSRVVVIGDFDFIANINIRQLFNRDFFLNALNWAMGEAEGVTIRPRTMKESRTIIPERQLLSLFLFSAVLVPEILLIVGLGCWWFRRD